MKIKTKKKRIIALMMCLLMVATLFQGNGFKALADVIDGESAPTEEMATVGDAEEIPTEETSLMSVYEDIEAQTMTAPEPELVEEVIVPQGLGGVTINGFTAVMVGPDDNRVNLDEVTEVYEGQEIVISYNWTLSNETNEADFQVDLRNYVKNIRLQDSVDAPVMSGNVQIGTVTIENGVATYHIFDAGSNKTGSSTLKGQIHPDDVNTENGTDMDFLEGGFTSNTVKYYTEPNQSSLAVTKSANGNVSYNSFTGKYEQKFDVSLQAQNGFVTNINVSDILDVASKLTDMSSITIAEANNATGVVRGTSYTTIDELNVALASAKISNGGNIKLSYTMAVDKSVFNPSLNLSADDSGFGNKIKATYTDNRNVTGKESTSTRVTPYADKPSISKTPGSPVLEGGTYYITWTVDLYLKSYYRAGADLSSMVSSVTDVLGPNLTGSDVDIPINNFTSVVNEPGHYQAIVKTPVKAGIIGNPAGSTIENTVKFTTTEGYEYEGKGSYQNTVPDSDWIEKTATAIDRDNKIITWAVKVHIPSDVSKLSSFVLEDNTGNSVGKHNVQNTVVVQVDGELPITVVENGIVRDTSVATGYNPIWEGYALSLQKSFMLANQGKDVTFTYKTKITDEDWDSETPFTNRTAIKMHDDLEEKDKTFSAEHTWYDITKIKNAISKSGKQVVGKNAIEYTIDVNLSYISNMSVGQVITLTDTLPENTILDVSSVEAYLFKYYYYLNGSVKVWNYTQQYYNGEFANPLPTSGGAVYDEATNKLTVKYAITQSILDELTTGVNNSYAPIIRLTYTVDVKDLTKVYKDNKKEFTNEVKGTIGDGVDIGSQKITTPISPKEIVTKSHVYTQDTAPYVEYTVHINENADKLTQSGKLTAVDSLSSGSCMTYETDTIQVFEVASDGTETELIKGADCDWVHNSSAKTLTFTVPDEKHIKITYKTKVNLKTYLPPNQAQNEHLTEENASNSFSLSGYTSEKTATNDKIMTIAYTPYHQGSAETKNITLKKFWTDGQDIVALKGSVFRIDEMKYNTQTRQMEYVSTFKDNITIDADEGTYIVEGLYLDRIYALYETSSPNGFSCEKEPYYFVVPGNDNLQLPQDITIKKFDSDNFVLDYENYKEGIIEISKTISNEAFDNIKNDITFIISKGGTVYAEVPFKDFTQSGDKYIYSVKQLPPGNYFISEKIMNSTTSIIDKVEYKYTQTDYTTITGIDDGGAKTYKTGEIAVVSEGVSGVDIKNTYQTGELEITKTVSGTTLPNQNNYEAVKFTVKDAGGTIVATETLASIKEKAEASRDGYTYESATKKYVWKLKNLRTGEYKVEETNTEITGFLDVIRYTIGVGGAENMYDSNSAPSVAVNPGEVSYIGFNNTYYSTSSRITIKKTIVGLDFEDVKDSITFKVYESGTTNIAKYDSDNDGVPDRDMIFKASDLSFTRYGNTYIGVLTYAVQAGRYDVVEVNDNLPLGYSVSVIPENSARTVDVQSGGSVQAEFTNTYTRDKGKLIIKKTLAGADIGKLTAAQKANIKFTITGPLDWIGGDNGTNVKTITVGDMIADVVNDNIYSYTIESAPTGTYKVVESNYSVEGFTCNTTYLADVGIAGDHSINNIIVNKNQTINVAFTNSYTQNKSYITITKKISGDVTAEEAKGKLVFKVKNNLTGDEQEFKLSNASDFTYDANTKTFTSRSLEVVAGGYTVTETSYDIEGYDCVSITYQIDNENVQDVTDATEKSAIVNAIANGRTYKIAFEDEYEAIGNLHIAKSISGDVTENDAVEKIEFEITDPSGVTETYTLKDDFVKVGPVYILKLDNVAVGDYKVKESKYLVNGYVSTVEYALIAEQYLDGKDQTVPVTVAKGATTNIAFRNAYTENAGKLKITKRINGPVTEQEARGALEFKVTNNDTNVVNIYKLSEFDYDNQNDIYTLELKETVGGYKVQEVVYDIDGYIADSVTYSVDGAQAQDGKGTAADINITLGRTTVVAFQDDYHEESGVLEIKKTIKGNVTKEEAEGALEFKVTNLDNGISKVYKLSDGNFVYDETTGVYTLTLRKTVGGYTVEETVYDISGYKVESVKYTVGNGEKTEGTKANVAVTDGAKTTVAFEDVYSVLPGKLVITKEIKGPVTEEEAKGALQFKVTNNREGTSKTYTLAEFEYDKTKDIYTLELEALPGGYTVEETVYSIEGYKLDTVKYGIDGSDKVVGTKATATVESGKTTTVAYEDEYSVITGKLVITKEIKGPITEEEAKGALQFKVTNNREGTSKTYTLADFEYDKTKNIYTLELEAVPGGYTVEETIFSIEGYRLDTIKYGIDGRDKVIGTKATVSVESGKTTTVAYEDEYSTETTTETTVTTETNTSDKTTTTTTISSEVKTGDATPVKQVCILMLISVVGMLGLGILIRLNKKDEE